MKPAIVVALPGFARDGQPELTLSGYGLESVIWLLEHRREVEAFAATLTPEDVGRYVDLPLPKAGP